MATDEASQRVNVEEVMARVRSRVRARSGVTAAQELAGTNQGGGVDRILGPSVLSTLHQANLLATVPAVEYELGWRTPVIGHAWREVRRRIHQEIRIYLDAMWKQQAAFNVSIVKVLTGIVRGFEAMASQSEVEELRARIEEVTQLREEVAELRKQLELLRRRLDDRT